MKKWGMIFGLLLAILLQGTGMLPGGKEMEELTLITALAVDRSEEEILVTAITGARQSREEEPKVLTGQGKRLSDACRDMELSQPTRAYLGQTRQLLLGEEAARGSWCGVFDQILSGGPLRLDTLLYIIEGEAGEGLCASLDLGAEGETAETGKTVGEVLSRLTEGAYTTVPLLSRSDTGTLTRSGWAVAGPEGITEQLKGDAARGAALLQGIGGREVVVLPSGCVELRSVSCRISHGVLYCRLTGERTEGTGSDRELSAWGERCIAAALRESGGKDCWGLERRQKIRGGKPVSPRELKIEVTGKVVE